MFRRALLALHTDVSLVSISNPELTAKTATMLVNARLNSLRGCDAISKNPLDPNYDIDNIDDREDVIRDKLFFDATSPDVLALLQSQSVARLAKLEETIGKVQASTAGGRKAEDAPPGSKPSAAEQTDGQKTPSKRPPLVYPPLQLDCPSFIIARAAGYDPVTKKSWQTCFHFADTGSPCRRGEACRHLHSWPIGITPAEKIAYTRYIAECKASFGWE
jgi:hypothetical protein